MVRGITEGQAVPLGVSVRAVGSGSPSVIFSVPTEVTVPITPEVGNLLWSDAVLARILGTKLTAKVDWPPSVLAQCPGSEGERRLSCNTQRKESHYKPDDHPQGVCLSVSSPWCLLPWDRCFLGEGRGSMGGGEHRYGIGLLK